MDKSPYDVLGVSHGATPDEIRKGFRRLALILHPDKGGDAEKFKAINAAYQTLSDPAKKAAYDILHAAAPDRGPSAIDDLFNDFFDGAPPARNQASAAPPQNMDPGEDVSVVLTITLEESLNGCYKQVTVEGSRANVKCGPCGGGGAQSGTRRTPCLSCHGRGRQGFSSRKCQACRGMGTVPLAPCKECHGTGRMKYSTSVRVRIPSGVSDQTVMKVAGHGTPGHPPGDLYMTVSVAPDPRFRREGADMHTTRAVTMKHAILGGPLVIDEFGGLEKEVQVPPGTQPGDTIRLKGCGVRSPLGGQTGDLVIHLSVKLPRVLSERGRKLLEELTEELTRGVPQ